MTAVALRAERVCVSLAARDVAVVQDVDLELAPGEILGLAGESGSGKTTLGLALLGYARRGTRIAGGRVWLGETDVLALDAADRGRLRGSRIAYLPQDPGTALNPAQRLGTQVLEVLAVHDSRLSDAERKQRLATAMTEVGLPGDEAFLRRYPHQISGGQQQRVAIAMAFIGRPAVIVLDEPTTGLDVITQQRILETLRTLCRSHSTAAVYITHDLAVVGGLADRVAVMYSGRLVEQGPTAELLSAPAHPYTQRLLDAVPEPRVSLAVTGLPGHAPSPGERPSGCVFVTRCEHAQEQCATPPQLVEVAERHVARCHFAAPRAAAMRPPRVLRGAAGEPARLAVRGLAAWHGSFRVLEGISFEAYPGECLALVGESGSGKSTLSRCLVGLHHGWSGAVELDGSPLAVESRRRPASIRRELQYVFQNPYASLNPKQTILQIVARPLITFGTTSRSKLRAEVTRALEQVALDGSYCDRLPSELSGGERQRVAIARAIATRPSVLLCDEITSALDVSVQASLVTLLEDLRDEFGLTLLFVTHNLALVRSIASRVAVLDGGRLIEVGTTSDVLDRSQEDYTRRLLEHTPSLEAARGIVRAG